jgi:hypothetical protein
MHLFAAKQVLLSRPARYRPLSPSLRPQDRVLQAPYQEDQDRALLGALDVARGLALAGELS